MWPVSRNPAPPGPARQTLPRQGSANHWGGKPKPFQERHRTFGEKNKLAYTITAGASGPISFSGIPRAFVFDIEGQLVFNGNPHDSDFDKSIKKALRNVGTTPQKSGLVSENLFETRSWKNAEGNELKAAVRDATDTEVTFVMFGGKVVKYPLEKLSEECRAEIATALAEKDEE